MALASFEQALASPDVVAAFSTIADGGAWTLSIYAVSEGAPRQLAVRMVPQPERERVEAELEGRGVRVGEYDEAGSFIWSRMQTLLTAWGPGGRAFDCHDDVIELPYRTVSRRDVNAVVTWGDESMVKRGIRIELRDGSAIAVAEESAPAPLADPGYSRNELLFDSAWAGILGYRLADWIGCPFRDEI